MLCGWSCSGSPSDAGSGGSSSGGGSNASGGAAADGFGGDSEDGGGGTNSTGGVHATGGASLGVGGTGGAITTLATELFPLGMGYSWTTNAPSVDSSCDPAYPDQEVYAVALVDGREAWVMTYPCFAQDPAEDALLAVIDGQIAQFLGSSWQTTLALPVEEGHTWTIQNEDMWLVFTWHAAGEVTVPAGTFTDCWRREEASEPGYGVTYCPGVGPVRWAYVSNTTELTAYDFD
jgi:hypothetical protein